MWRPVSKVTTVKGTTFICLISGVSTQLCYENVFLLITRVALSQNISEQPLYTQEYVPSAPPFPYARVILDGG